MIAPIPARLRTWGMVKVMPWAAVGFIIGGLVSMGMPGFSGFVAELPIYLGVWRVAPVVAIISALSIVITAAYILLIVRRVFFGELPENFDANMPGISLKDKISIGLLSMFMIVIGIFPGLMVPLIESGVNHILSIVGRCIMGTNLLVILPEILLLVLAGLILLLDVLYKNRSKSFFSWFTAAGLMLIALVSVFS